MAIISLKFAEGEIGVQRRKRCADASAAEMGSTGVEAEEERVTNKGQLFGFVQCTKYKDLV